jgi:tripartite-type tricarboxylate transporter receptor subunit TctC
LPGCCQVAKAAADGYTILFAFSSHVVNPTLFARVPYDPIKDFDPVTLAVASTTLLTVNSSVPAKTVRSGMAFSILVRSIAPGCPDCAPK